MYLTPAYMQYIHTFLNTYTYAHAELLMDLGEVMDLPWHTAGRVNDYGGLHGDIVVVCFQCVRGVQLNNPLHLPRTRALLDRGGRSIAQNARGERWRRRRLCAWGCILAWAREAG